jgi:CRP-like cAMP-binding protein
VLGSRELFGELAALDPEPRSASVTAIEDTLLFRLDERVLYEMMAENQALTRGLIRMLCRQLRSRQP